MGAYICVGVLVTVSGMLSMMLTCHCPDDDAHANRMVLFSMLCPLVAYLAGIAVSQ